MSFLLSPTSIFVDCFGEDSVAAEFSQEKFVARLLEVEAALAGVQADLGLIPGRAARDIAGAAAIIRIDYPRLQAETARAGFPIIELVHQLRTAVGPDAAPYVHWGATTQDIMDTALVLQMRAALDRCATILDRLITSLAPLADSHRKTLMAGRTHSQQALPIPFGLKVAGWIAPLLRHRQRLEQIKPRLLCVQFGGAAGTLASLPEAGCAVQEALANALCLSLLSTPWHTQRDGVGEIAAWLSLVSGSLAKIAQDIILLAQSEIAEVRESADRSRGGSSTMPQKSNPTVSETIIAAARTNAALLSAVHQALVQEHERGTHGWQIEWLNLPQMFVLTAGALENALWLGENLSVDTQRMAANVAASNGLMLAEAITFALSESMDRAEAKSLVTQACQRAIVQDRHLVDVIAEQTTAPVDWNSLRDERKHFGASDEFIDRVLRTANDVLATAD